VGANIGQYALYAAKRLEGKCRVFAFEPEALNFAKLNRNIVLNGLTESVTAYCLAVADRSALDIFYVKSFAPGAALHTWGRPVTQGEVAFTPQNRQGSMGVTLDELTGRYGLPFPAHLKVDVDGIEEGIVRGARRIIADRRLKTVLIEVFMHENIARRIETEFFANDYSLYNAGAIDYSPGIVQNLIFVRA
jgi:FkbM family methyltransferase